MLSKTRKLFSGDHGILVKLLMIPALLLMPFYELAEYLSGKAYKGWGRLIINGLVGFACAGVGATATAWYLGWVLNWWLIFWGMSMVASWLAIMFIVYPAIAWYLLEPFLKHVVKPVVEGIGDFFEWTDKQAEETVKPCLDGLLDTIQKLPLAGRLWNYVRNKDSGSNWVSDVVVFLTGAALVGIAGWIGYVIYTGTATLLPATWTYGTPAIAGLIAGIPTITALVLLLQVLAHSKLPFASLFVSGAVVYGTKGYMASASAALTLPAWAPIATMALAFLLIFAYVYPALHALLKSNAFKKLLEGVQWMVENTYSEENEDYRRFFSQVCARLFTIAVAIGSFWALGFVPVIPFAAAIAISVVVLVFAYLWIGDTVSGDGPAVLLGLGSAGATGWYMWNAYQATWNAVAFWPALVLGVVLAFSLAFPIVYLFIRVLTKWASAPVGNALEKSHAAAYKAARKLTRWWDDNVLETAYDDDSKYGNLFLHVANLALLGYAVWQGLPMLSGWLASSIWLYPAIAGMALLTFITYVIIGKIMMSARAAFLGFGLGFVTLIWVGYEVHLTESVHWIISAAIGLAAASLVTYILIPVGYHVLKVLGNWKLPLLLEPVLSGLFNRIWKRFERIWDRFVKAYMIAHEKYFKPFVLWIGSILAAAKELWDSLLGRNKKRS